MKRAARAFTLVELMMYTVILAFFMTGVYGALSLSQHSYAVTSAQADAVDSAMIGINQMSRMLATAAGNTITVQGSAVAFVSAQPPTIVFNADNLGNSLWQKWVCFYLDTPTQALMRSESPITPTSTTPAPATAAMMATFTGGPSAGVQVFEVAKNIESLTFPAAGTPDGPVSVSGTGPPQLAYTLTSSVRASTAQTSINAGIYKVVLTGHFTPRQ